MRPIVLLVVILLCMTSVSAYTADVIIEVKLGGRVVIQGESDHPLLQAGSYNDLTSKKNGLWLLNITTPDVFESYRYDLILPPGTTINYLSTHDVSTVQDDDGLHISGKAENKPFTLILQYESKPIETQSMWLTWFLLGTGAIILLTYFWPKKKATLEDYPRYKFSEREYLIVDLLRKNNQMLSQADIQKKTALAKASLHRNLKSLEKKGVVEINPAGMSNKIVLK